MRSRSASSRSSEPRASSPTLCDPPNLPSARKVAARLARVPQLLEGARKWVYKHADQPAPRSCAGRTDYWRCCKSTGRSTKRTTTTKMSRKAATSWRATPGRLSAHSSTSWWRPAGLSGGAPREHPQTRRLRRGDLPTPGPDPRPVPQAFQDFAVLSSTLPRAVSPPEPCGFGHGPVNPPAARRATSEGEDWTPAMSLAVPPARPRLEHPRVKRVAHLKLSQGKITIEQDREAIVPRPLPHQERWDRGRG